VDDGVGMTEDKGLTTPPSILTAVTIARWG
jgi:hypothetical protein